MDYLLNLLEQPYGESFLRLYNFLWDRMRAIRMDLRMQHIFNREAINMLEQMVDIIVHVYFDIYISQASWAYHYLFFRKAFLSETSINFSKAFICESFKLILMLRYTS